MRNFPITIFAPHRTDEEVRFLLLPTSTERRCLNLPKLLMLINPEAVGGDGSLGVHVREVLVGGASSTNHLLERRHLLGISIAGSERQPGQGLPRLAAATTWYLDHRAERPCEWGKSATTAP